MDLIKNKYHIFNPENAKKKGYYPKELLQMIEELPNFEKEFNIEVGEIYTVRAFFAISKPINNEVGYQSGFLGRHTYQMFSSKNRSKGSSS